MKNKVSPLAPKKMKSMQSIPGINIYTYSANLYKNSRLDVLFFLFDDEFNIAEVFTQSKTRSITLDWNEKNLKKGKVKAIIINSGNANTFTGDAGVKAMHKLVNFISQKFDILSSKIFVASTGVIGEPFPFRKIINAISKFDKAKKSNWLNAAKAIMTTDTFPKVSEASAMIDGKKVTIKGIAKGSGMIAPNMATMLGFIFTDANINRSVLQSILSEINEETFNTISVDGDESTNDTVMLISTNASKHKNIKNKNDRKLKDFVLKLKTIMGNLSEQIVRDGEGATKLVNISVSGAKNTNSAKSIARSVAQSPLVKTAIYGEDPNWGRIVMAIGKSGEPINKKKLKIKIGSEIVAKNGTQSPAYNESKLKNYMKNDQIIISIDLGIGKGTAKMMTCDYSYDYIRINASYKT
ncbi:bifunctional glutamate N-acetyltransferase/amino-acid acetyltransferase ArgJ [Pelagibacteraceae bacterium]|nr:bifunctional glutamate N-acetyltransferase/amino-acid acetyltransferase ArgJ [Pelagibacteraceae bacterium]